MFFIDTHNLQFEILNWERLFYAKHPHLLTLETDCCPVIHFPDQNWNIYQTDQEIGICNGYFLFKLIMENDNKEQGISFLQRVLLKIKHNQPMKGCWTFHESLFGFDRYSIEHYHTETHSLVLETKYFEPQIIPLDYEFIHLIANRAVYSLHKKML